MNWAAVDVGILGPALLAGLLVLATHVPLGTQVLDRGIVFIDLAIAQIAGLGVIAADVAGLPTSGPLAQLAAVGSALAGAALLTWTERRMGSHQEALIGVLFVVAATGSLLLLSGHPHGAEHLKEMLIGQILWVTPEQVGWLAAASALVLLGWRTAMRRLGAFGFYALFAVSVTASVQIVGVYLVFSSLIVPALATRGAAPGARRLVIGYAIGVVGFAVGLAASALFDLPTGAVVVWTLGAVGLLAAGVSRRSPAS